MEDGFVVRIGSEVRLAEPLEVVFIGGMAAEAVAYHPRNLVIVEEGSSLTLVEHHVGIGGGAYFANSVTELQVRDEGHLRRYVLQSEGDQGLYLETVHAEVGRDATLEAFGLASGGRLARSEISVRLDGPGARCVLAGAYVCRGKQVCDNTTLIEHRAPNTTCREVFKGVLDDAARGVFQGCIVVHRGARNADGHQLSKALLLSDAAEIDQKPELRIFADEVKCSHGAAVGQLDRDALFYLRARGLPEDAARRLLIEAFLAEAFEEISVEEVREAGNCANLVPSLAFEQNQAIRSLRDPARFESATGSRKFRKCSPRVPASSLLQFVISTSAQLLDIPSVAHCRRLDNGLQLFPQLALLATRHAQMR